MATEREMGKEEFNRALPIARNEDVEFSEALADEDDLEAAERAKAADERAERRS